MKKAVSLLLALTMVFALAACGGNGGSNPSNTPTGSAAPGNSAAPGGSQPGNQPGDQPGGNDNPGPAPAAYTGPDWAAIDAMNHDDASDALYEWNLGVYKEYYQKAKAEMNDLDKRAALMALAEAKLMESALLIPTTTAGGNYAISRVVPRSASSVTWGLDQYRYLTALVANEFIKSEDRTQLVNLWTSSANEAAWLAAAKKFLADNGYTLSSVYNMESADEIQSWDIVGTSFASDSELLACTINGLLEYDAKNVLQPALAESYTVSDDGLTYTFKIRQGVKWVDQQGREFAEVTAQDWVSSMMHLIDNNDALGYLMTISDGCGLKNYDAYLNGDVTDFAEVGVKALDKYTLQYTLEAPFPSFVTMMGYGVLAPLNAEFYKSQGGTFSAEGAEYTSGTYGTSPSTILYNGPYLVTNYTAKNIITYKANPSYWDKSRVNTPEINLLYNDGTDTLRAYNDAKSGVCAGAGLNASALKLARQEKPEGSDKTYADLYMYTSATNATSYCGWVNLNRKAFANFNDATKGVSTQPEAERSRTRSAMNNQNFRLAIAFAFDHGAYNAVSKGEELRYSGLRNSYTPGTFLVLSKDVTVDINGKSSTFKAGTFYGEIEQAQLNADGVPIKVWDPTGGDGTGDGDGFDGWYNPTAAKEYMQKAIAELAQIGVEISKDNPIHMDVPYGTYNEIYVNRHQVYKQSLESALDGLVVVDLVPFDDQTSWTYSYYRTGNGEQSNYDSTPGTSGWGPDYGDAQSFLDTIQQYGYMTKNIGLY